MLSSLEQRVLRLTQAITCVGFAALLLLALATVADVFGRGAFGRPLHGVGDLAAVAMAVIVASSLPACFAERRNIGVDLLGNLLGKRAAQWLDLFGHIVTLIFIVILAWQLCRYAADIQRSGQTTFVLRFTVAPWWWVAAGLAAATVPVQLLVTLRALAAALADRVTPAGAPHA